MLPIEEQPPEQAETAAPEEAEPASLDQGYSLEISVLPDGTFQVSPPEALEIEAQEEEGDAPGSDIGETFESVGELLKGILSVIKANPAGGSDQQNFEAGYGQG